MKIWTENEMIEVDPFDIGQLSRAMRFKSEHIHAKADPELFHAVAFALDEMWERLVNGGDNDVRFTRGI